MKESEDKRLEKFIDNVMISSKLETPTLDFTEKIMSKIEVTKSSEIYVYKPLISKSVFAFVFIFFVSVFIYFIQNGEVKSDSWTSQLDFTIFYNNYLNFGFNFSRITIYTVVFTTIMLYIQVGFLKKHFDKQLFKS